MGVIRKKIGILLAVVLTGSFYFAGTARAEINLVKSASRPVVYYLDEQGVRYPFPNEITFQSWYGQDFSKVVTISDKLLAAYPLDKNVTLRPGKFLVKVPSDPKVYAVERGGVLRWLELPAVAEAIYGSGWQKKIVDLPEVFFDNYTLGESLKHDYEIPDSIVYQVKNENKYYWKSNRVLQPFSSLQAVLTNGYGLDDVVAGKRLLYSRRRPITGFDKRIFNPVALPLTKKLDCENKNLKVAFIFVSSGNYNSRQLEKLETIKKELPKSFNWATNDLAKINLDYPTIIFQDDGYLVSTNSQGEKKLTEEISFSFYDTHPDEFDFLIIFTNFNAIDNEEIASFIPITNNVAGLGKAVLDAAETFGSHGKLKGLIIMDHLDKYDPSTTPGMNSTQNYLLHEILHQWAGSIKFIDEAGGSSNDLLRATDLDHWSYYAGFLSPLGGSGWQDNGDGTFTSKVSQMKDPNKKSYAELDLYLMGLLPAQVIKPVMYMQPENPNALGNTIRGTAKSVTIDQIVQANGRWECEQ